MRGASKGEWLSRRDSTIVARHEVPGMQFGHFQDFFRVNINGFLPRKLKEDLALWPKGADQNESRRDGPIVAWHEVPGTKPSQKSRPVGYGMIRADVRIDTI